MLLIENASIGFNDVVLFSDFNFLLQKGEIACIGGDSGCGKTSLLNAIIGFVPLSAGRIVVDGYELNKTNIELIRKSIAWIPQELALPSEWVREMVQLPFDLKANKSSSFSKEKLFEYFEELGLASDLYYKRVSEISGGQRQRIMIAVAALLRKPLIIVDEPTSALDIGSTDRVMNFFNKQANAGVAVLAVSHDKKFADGCKYQIQL